MAMRQFDSSPNRGVRAICGVLISDYAKLVADSRSVGGAGQTMSMMQNKMRVIEATLTSLVGPNKSAELVAQAAISTVHPPPLDSPQLSPHQVIASAHQRDCGRVGVVRRARQCKYRKRATHWPYSCPLNPAAGRRRSQNSSMLC